MHVFALFVGGGLGALSRHLVGSALLQWTPWPPHFATFIVNVSGCFAMGVLVTFVGLKSGWSEATRLFLFTGFLGSYTTFSTYILESFLMWESKAWLLPILSYLLGSLIFGMLALSLGIKLAKAILAT